MITVEEAKAILIKNVFEISKKKRIKINDALGCSLAEDIYAPLNLPSFDQANVDGYAVRYSSSTKNTWKVVAEIKAGDNPTVQLKKGEAVRIFTGALVPKESDMVIMQEKIVRNGNIINYTETLSLKKGEHIRMEGAQIKKGDLALNKGTPLNPAAISFLNALGLTEVIN